MLYVYYTILGAIFFATFAMCIQQGLWNNTLSTINILLSGLIAFACYSPLAKLIADNGGGEYTFLLDFLCIWLVYVIAFLVLHRVLSQMLSKTRMRFKHPIDPVGGPLMAAVAGWLMTGIVAASLHAAPFDKDCFGGALTKSGRSAATNPDVMWLNVCQNVFASENLGKQTPSFTQAKYIQDFNKQREALEKQESLRVNR